MEAAGKTKCFSAMAVAPRQTAAGLCALLCKQNYFILYNMIAMKQQTNKQNKSSVGFVIEFKLRSIPCVDVQVPTNCLTFQKKLCPSERERRLSLSRG